MNHSHMNSLIHHEQQSSSLPNTAIDSRSEPTLLIQQRNGIFYQKRNIDWTTQNIKAQNQMQCMSGLNLATLMQDETIEKNGSIIQLLIGKMISVDTSTGKVVKDWAYGNSIYAEQGKDTLRSIGLDDFVAILPSVCIEEDHCNESGYRNLKELSEKQGRAMLAESHPPSNLNRKKGGKRGCLASSEERDDLNTRMSLMSTGLPPACGFNSNQDQNQGQPEGQSARHHYNGEGQDHYKQDRAAGTASLNATEMRSHRQSLRRRRSNHPPHNVVEDESSELVVVNKLNRRPRNDALRKKSAVLSFDEEESVDEMMISTRRSRNRPRRSEVNRLQSAEYLIRVLSGGNTTRTESTAASNRLRSTATTTSVYRNAFQTAENAASQQRTRTAFDKSRGQPHEARQSTIATSYHYQDLEQGGAIGMGPPLTSSYAIPRMSSVSTSRNNPLQQIFSNPPIKSSAIANMATLQKKEKGLSQSALRTSGSQVHSSGKEERKSKDKDKGVQDRLNKKPRTKERITDSYANVTSSKPSHAMKTHESINYTTQLHPTTEVSTIRLTNTDLSDQYPHDHVHVPIARHHPMTAVDQIPYSLGQVVGTQQTHFNNYGNHNFVNTRIEEGTPRAVHLTRHLNEPLSSANYLD